MWNNPKIIEEAHPSLGAIRNFVKNCEHRGEVEARLRNKNGSGDDDPVLLPDGLGDNGAEEETTNEVTYD